MFRRLALVVFALLLVVPVAAAATDDFRPEQQRLKPADVKLAKKITLKRTDLGAGWKGASIDAASDDDFGLASCEGFDLDLSAFTITGRAASSFEHAEGNSITSSVEVYPTKAQAAGDFTAATTHPLLIQCIRTALEQELTGEIEPGLTMAVAAVEQLPAPRVGQRSHLFRVRLELTFEGVKVDAFIDALSFQKGRTIVALMFVGALEPVPNQVAIARKVAARMR